jgi:hypothetical protein
MYVFPFVIHHEGFDEGVVLRVSRDIGYVLGKKWGREPFLDRIDRVDALASSFSGRCAIAVNE